MLSPENEWRSCCFNVDKRCLIFLIQSIIGVGMLLFCALRLTYEPECDKAAPYWGLIGSVSGFFFNTMMPHNPVNLPNKRVRDLVVLPTE